MLAAMSTPPPKTFHLQTARDRHDMLVWEVEQLIDTSVTDARLVAYRIVHCAISAWHMTDWVFEGLDDERRREWSVGNDGSLIGFKKWARLQQPLLSILPRTRRIREAQGYDP